MAFQKVSELTEATGVGDSDLAYVVQSGVSKKASLDTLKAYMQMGGTVSGLDGLSLLRTTTNGVNATIAALFRIEASPNENEVVTPASGWIVNQGSSPAIYDPNNPPVGHCVGVIGVAADTSAGKIDLWGVEGRLYAKGVAGTHAAVVGIAEFEAGDNGTFNGRVIHGVRSRCDILKHNGETPGKPKESLGEGTAIAFYAQKPVGGDSTKTFSFYGEAGRFLNHGPAEIKNQSGSGAVHIARSDDANEAYVLTTSGHLRIGTAANGFVVLHPGTAGMIGAEGWHCGYDGFRCALAATSGSFSGAVSIQGGGANVLTYGEKTANGSTSVALGSVAPSGASTGAPKGWMKVSVQGEDGYVPYW